MIGWVQDYSSIILGVREEGQSFGALSYRLISPRSRSIPICKEFDGRVRAILPLYETEVRGTARLKRMADQLFV